MRYAWLWLVLLRLSDFHIAVTVLHIHQWQTMIDDKGNELTSWGVRLMWWSSRKILSMENSIMTGRSGWRHHITEFKQSCSLVSAKCHPWSSSVLQCEELEGMGSSWFQNMYLCGSWGSIWYHRLLQAFIGWRVRDLTMMVLADEQRKGGL